MAATPPMADPIRAAYARQQAAKKGPSTQFVRLLGFAAPSPDFDIAAYDEQAALAAAVAEQEAAGANPRAVRTARIRARIFAPGKNT
ncbi:MAG TPA: hypothetical protein VGA04_18080 [Streptosporangiaceae bacterium]